MSPIIRAITRADYTPWQSIFQAYVTFYKSFLPDTQYQTTFGRLINSETTELHGLVMVHPEDPDKLIGFAHFFPHQTPWSEKKIMHLNGNSKSRSYSHQS